MKITNKCQNCPRKVQNCNNSALIAKNAYRLAMIYQSIKYFTLPLVAWSYVFATLVKTVQCKVGQYLISTQEIREAEKTIPLHKQMFIRLVLNLWTYLLDIILLFVNKFTLKYVNKKDFICEHAFTGAGRGSTGQCSQLLR